MLDASFLSLILNTMLDHITVLDAHGTIIYTNQAWVNFGQCNDCDKTTNKDWVGTNYLTECKNAKARGDTLSASVLDGLERCYKEKKAIFTIEYPCHSPTEQRWFILRASRMTYDNEIFLVISHQDISRRKLSELKIEELSRTDPLTGLANRRSFSELMAAEWSRCKRFSQPFSMIMIDLDYFKKVNDKLGHLEGDECLKQFSKVLTLYTKRANDISARYGGEEFALAYGGLDQFSALLIADKIQRHISALALPNPGSPLQDTLTFSAGVATMTPRPGDNETDIIAIADQCLYAAKQAGRNCIAYVDNGKITIKNNLTGSCNVSSIHTG